MANTNTCLMCNTKKPANDLIKSYSPFWENYTTCFCYKCVCEKFELSKIDLNVANRICQFFNVAFFPDEWIKLFRNETPENALRKYMAMYFDINYKTYNWIEQNEALLKAASLGTIDNHIEELTPALEQKLKHKWGGELEMEDLLRMEEQYNASVADYNISTDLQRSMLQKIVRMSIMIDKQLNVGQVDKDLINQYKNMVKELVGMTEKLETTGITSISQLLEKIETLGFKPQFDFSSPRDKLDLAIKNIQDYNRDLFIGESLIVEQYEQTKQLMEQADKELNFDNIGGEDDDDEEANPW